MPTRPDPTPAATVLRASRCIFACIGDRRARGRLESALRSHATITWFDTFAELRSAIAADDRPVTVIVGMRDSNGDTALGLAQRLRISTPGTAIVVSCDLAESRLASIPELAQAGVHDVLFTGINDDGHSARMIIFGAALGAAADVVMGQIASSIPPSLSRFVDLAVRRPRELRRVADVAVALNVPRQTIGRWCRASMFIGPEELLMWVRVLLVAAMLEATDRTLESIAYEMQYGSPTALRNRIREYTGMTATQLRNSGLRHVISAFQRRLAFVRDRTEGEAPGRIPGKRSGNMRHPVTA